MSVTDDTIKRLQTDPPPRLLTAAQAKKEQERNEERLIKIREGVVH